MNRKYPINNKLRRSDIFYFSTLITNTYSQLYVYLVFAVNGRFEWQEGFDAFSVNESQISKLIGYFQKQEMHQKKRSFHTE